MSQAAYVTVELLKKMNACPLRYRRLMRGVEFDDADEVRIPLRLILEVNGVQDWLWAAWCLHCKTPPGSAKVARAAVLLRHQMADDLRIQHLDWNLDWRDQHQRGFKLTRKWLEAHTTEIRAINRMRMP